MTNRHEVTEEAFLKDIEKHQMFITNDEGFYRHIEFRIPNSSDKHFEITTWPGYLCLSGDMGNYVWSRPNTDMIYFFPWGGNRHYISEKLVCDSVQEPYRVFDQDNFNEIITKWFDQYKDDHPDNENLDEIWEDIAEQVLNQETEEASFHAANEFISHDFMFTDFWETPIMVKSYHYRWCLCAAMWGTQQYINATRKVKQYD